MALNWDTFTAYNQYPLSRLDIVFDDLESFVKKICSDDMGKEALQDKMSTIQLTNSDNNDDLKMELKDEITIVSSTQVVALTILDPSHYLNFFAAPENTAVVGSLELKRAVQNTENELENSVGKKIQFLLDINAFPENSRNDVLQHT